MITRLRAVAILHQHSWEPDTCIISQHDCLDEREYCETFNNALGIHSTYSYKALMIWLGY